MYASGSSHGLFYQAESVVGVAPVTPNTVELPITGTSLDINRDQLQSAKLRSDRMISDVRAGNQRITGAVNFEFCYGAFDEFIAAGLRGAWTNNVVKGGAADPVTFLFERGFTDIDQYIKFLGCHISKFSLDIKPNAIVTGSFDVTGYTGSVSGTQFDSTPTAANVNKAFDTFTGSLTEGGVALASVTGLNFSLDNGDEALFALCSVGAKGVSSKRSNLTGTMTTFFENGTLLGKFLSNTDSSLSLVLTNAGNSYTILIPRVVYTGGSIPTDSEGPLTLTMPFSGIYDTVTATNIQITRTPTTTTTTTTAAPTTTTTTTA
jgi:hypothetical protein